MAFVSVTQFAEMCDLPRKNLCTYIQRGKVKVNNGLIDTTDEFSVAFYNKREAKGQIKNRNSPIPVAKIASAVLPPPKDDPNREKRPYRKRSHVKDEQQRGADDEEEYEDEDDGADGLMSLSKAEKVYQHSRALRNQRGAELLDITIQQKRKELVRTDVVVPLFQQHNQSIAKELQALLESELRYMAKRFNLTHEEHVEVRGRFTVEINRMLDRAKDSTRRAVDNIIESIQA